MCDVCERKPSLCVCLLLLAIGRGTDRQECDSSCSRWENNAATSGNSPQSNLHYVSERNTEKTKLRIWDLYLESFLPGFSGFCYENLRVRLQLSIYCQAYNTKNFLPLGRHIGVGPDGACLPLQLCGMLRKEGFEFKVCLVYRRRHGQYDSFGCWWLET